MITAVFCPPVCVPTLQMGRILVPGLQGAPVHLRARGLQALERLGSSQPPNPVSAACAGHAVAQEGLLHRPRPGPGA